VNGLNDFQEPFDPAEAQNLLPILLPSLRNGNALAIFHVWEDNWSCM
jgi:hypothetical protein